MTDDNNTNQVTIDRPDHFVRDEITDKVERVTIRIISDDRDKTFNGESIVRADECYTDQDEFVATEVVFETHPDLMRGLKGATIYYTDGTSVGGPVPWSTTDGDQTFLVIDARWDAHRPR